MRHARPDYNRFQDPAGLIPDDEPVFILRAQDPDAANTVRAYAGKIEARGASREMVRLCREWADVMGDWPTKKVVADLPSPNDAIREPVEATIPADNIEPVFLLRGVSCGASEAVLFYREMLARAGSPPSVLDALTLMAKRMASWPTKTIPGAVASYHIEDPKNGDKDADGVM